jgi:sarcosine oxidase subunit delta
MRIDCPFCGERDTQEFVFRGDAVPTRPPDGDDTFAYVYLRNNPAGPMTELCYHAFGCRNWLAVTRDTQTHQVASVTLAGARAP